MDDEQRIEVTSAYPERYYVRIFHDFLDSTVLSANEKLVYIGLKSFINFIYDEGECYPSIETLCRRTSLSRYTVVEVIKKLIEKGLVLKKRRGLTQTNLYIVKDNPAIWKTETVAEMKKMAESRLPYTTEELLEELKQRGDLPKLLEKMEVSLPEKTQKKLATDSAKSAASKDGDLKSAHLDFEDNIEAQESQESYSMEWLRDYFDYKALIIDNPEMAKDFDVVLEIMYDTLNTTKNFIRIGGEDRPTNVVKSRLLKLTYEEIRYSIRKYREQTNRIRDPKGYLLTILYGAREQMELDVANQVKHDMHSNG